MNGTSPMDIEPKGSIQPAIENGPELLKFSSHSHNPVSLEAFLMLSLHLLFCFPSDNFWTGFHIKTLYGFVSSWIY
jgi:hypothetical protein